MEQPATRSEAIEYPHGVGIDLRISCLTILLEKVGALHSRRRGTW